MIDSSKDENAYLRPLDHCQLLLDSPKHYFLVLKSSRTVSNNLDLTLFPFSLPAPPRLIPPDDFHGLTRPHLRSVHVEREGSFYCVRCVCINKENFHKRGKKYNRCWKYCKLQNIRRSKWSFLLFECSWLRLFQIPRRSLLPI